MLTNTDVDETDSTGKSPSARVMGLVELVRETDLRDAIIVVASHAPVLFIAAAFGAGQQVFRPVVYAGIGVVSLFLLRSTLSIEREANAEFMSVTAYREWQTPIILFLLPVIAVVGFAVTVIEPMVLPVVFVLGFFQVQSGLHVNAFVFKALGYRVYEVESGHGSSVVVSCTPLEDVLITNEVNEEVLRVSDLSERVYVVSVV